MPVGLRSKTAISWDSFLFPLSCSDEVLFHTDSVASHDFKAI
jgi:hypothetical protein